MPSEDTQFKPGGDAVGNRGKGRPHFLSDPERVKQVAEAFAVGSTREEMCEVFGMSDPGTITRWRKDARVKAELRKLINDRILRISARTDNVLEERLQRLADELSVDELIKIRKEYGGSALARTDASDDAVLNEAMSALEENPELLDQIIALLEGTKSGPDEAEQGNEDEVPDAVPEEWSAPPSDPLG